MTKTLVQLLIFTRVITMIYMNTNEWKVKGRSSNHDSRSQNKVNILLHQKRYPCVETSLSVAWKSMHHRPLPNIICSMILFCPE